MVHVMCAVRDRQLNAYMRPFTAQTTGQAIRSFRDEVNRQGSELNQHPEDYELFQIGLFDDATGALIQVIQGAQGGADELPRQIAIATNLIERT